MNGPRIARNVSAGLVATIAAWSSYSHMAHVALGYGERPEVAHVLPLSVDGMLVVASVAMVDDKRAGRKVRTSARVAFAVGVVASIAANIAAAHPSVGARIVAGWPALALLLVVELLSRSGRTAPAPVVPAAADEDKVVVPDTVVSPVPTSAPVEVLAPAVTASATAAGVDTSRSPGRTVSRTPGRTPTAVKVARLAAKTPDASADIIAAKVGVSERTVRRHLAAMTADNRPDTTPVNGRKVLADR